MKIKTRIKDLDKVLETIHKEVYLKHKTTLIVKDEGEAATSFDSLANESDIPNAKNSIYDRIELSTSTKYKLTMALAKMYPACSIVQSGRWLYPKRGYMGWHTNSNSVGKRIYLTYCPSDKSFFRYIKDGKKITSQDLVGWTMREFDIDVDNPLWHCVYAAEPRLSIGFRVIHNLKDPVTGKIE